MPARATVQVIPRLPAKATPPTLSQEPATPALSAGVSMRTTVAVSGSCSRPKNAHAPVELHLRLEYADLLPRVLHLLGSHGLPHLALASVNGQHVPRHPGLLLLADSGIDPKAHLITNDRRRNRHEYAACGRALTSSLHAFGRLLRRRRKLRKLCTAATEWSRRRPVSCSWRNARTTARRKSPPSDRRARRACTPCPGRPAGR